MVFINTCKIVVFVGKQNGLATIARGISSKAMRHRTQAEPKPAPFPYKEKRYNFFRALFDPTPARLDENSKLIVVEGVTGAGKANLARELAAELDMAYFAAPTQAEAYINEYGFNLKTLDPELPLTCKSYDENDFLKNPYLLDGTKAARFQLGKMMKRYKRYLEALAHILNSGQGVVMDRSPYSDFVYMDAMAEQGLVSKNIQKFYHRVRDNAMFALWRPHLVIYLDVPVAEARRRIEARNRPNEKESPATTVAYLQSMEKAYKEKFLKEMSVSSEVVVYDWTEVGDPEIVVEDLERLDLDKYTIYDTQMSDWRRQDKWDWNNSRQIFSYDQQYLLNYFNVPATSCGEINYPPEDYNIMARILMNAPGQKYAKGYNADMGDKGLLFKL